MGTRSPGLDPQAVSWLLVLSTMEAMLGGIVGDGMIWIAVTVLAPVGMVLVKVRKIRV